MWMPHEKLMLYKFVAAGSLLLNLALVLWWIHWGQENYISPKAKRSIRRTREYYQKKLKPYI